MIRHHPANARGRDFVIGDLHGCRAMLDRLLAEARFDPDVDRLFSVGDLVDRGPDSMGCLALLHEPWFHAVRGNHEAMLLDFVWDTLQFGAPLPFHTRHEFLLNGGEWIFRQFEPDEGCLSDPLTEALAAMRRLPFLRIVGQGPRRFHVVHTDLYHAGKRDEVLLDDDVDALAEEWRAADVNDLRPDDYPYFAGRWLWSRLIMGRLETQRFPKMVHGLSPTYCGHTIGTGVRRALSHVCIDTGAFIAASLPPEAGDYGLTMTDVETRQIYFARSES